MGHSDLRFDAAHGFDKEQGDLYYTAVGRENLAPGTTPRTYLFAFDTHARAERWRLKVPAAKEGAIMLLDRSPGLQVAYAADGALNLAEVDVRKGTMGRPFRHTWTPKGTQVSANPLTQQLYAFGAGLLTAAPLRVNKPVWQLNLKADPGTGEPPQIGTPLAMRIPGLGKVLYVTDAQRTVFAIDPVRGREIWRRTLLPDPPYTVATIPGVTLTKSARTLLAFGRGAGVVALDPRTGAVKWTFQSNQSAASFYRVLTVNDTALVMNGSAVFALPAG